MTSLRAQAESLAKCISETSDDFRPAISAFYQKLEGTFPPAALNEAAAVVFEYGTRACAIEREVNLYLVTGIRSVNPVEAVAPCLGSSPSRGGDGTENQARVGSVGAQG